MRKTRMFYFLIYALSFIVYAILVGMANPTEVKAVGGINVVLLMLSDLV